MKFKIKKYFRTITYNLLIFIICLSIIEISFGSWIKDNNFGNISIPKNIFKIINEYPYSEDRNGVYSRDKYGFRSNKYELSEIDILIFGGSTTEERYVDDNDIWTKVFEKNVSNSKKIQTINAGIGGQTSNGNVFLFKKWIATFDELKPKYVIFYIGINDSLLLDQYLFADKKKFLNGRVINGFNRDTLVSKNLIVNADNYIKNNSALYYLFTFIKGNYRSHKYKINYKLNKKLFKKNLLPYTKDNQKLFLNSKNIAKNLLNRKISLEENKKNLSLLNSYILNLENLTALSKSFGAEPIFITQTVSGNSLMGLGYFKTSIPLLKIVNYFTIKHCKENNLFCIDLASELNISHKYFIADGIHTLPIGSKKIGEYISEKFISKFLF